MKASWKGFNAHSIWSVSTKKSHSLNSVSMKDILFGCRCCWTHSTYKKKLNVIDSEKNLSAFTCYFHMKTPLLDALIRWKDANACWADMTFF